jgi:hypothetical protein
VHHVAARDLPVPVRVRDLFLTTRSISNDEEKRGGGSPRGQRRRFDVAARVAMVGGVPFVSEADGGDDEGQLVEARRLVVAARAAAASGARGLRLMVATPGVAPVSYCHSLAALFGTVSGANGRGEHGAL